MLLNQWNYHPGITEYERSLFHEALGRNVACYQPLSVARIDDMRYRFIANTVIGPSFPTEFSIIEIYRPPSGSPYVTRIIPLNVDL